MHRINKAKLIGKDHFLWFLFLKTQVLSYFREGNGTPLQYSCLENPMDGGAWWAQSMGSLRVGHNSVTSLSLFTFMHWRRKWQPTPVFLPGESRDRGAWWAAIYGVAHSQTRLKRLSSSSSSIPLYICMCVCVLYIKYIFFIHSSVDGYLGCFHGLAWLL